MTKPLPLWLALLLMMSGVGRAAADPPAVRHPVGWVLLGGGLFLGAAGAVLTNYGGWSSHDRCPTIQMTNRNCADDGRAYRDSGLAFVAAGGALLVAGVVVLAVGYRRDRLHPSPLAISSSGELQLRF